MLRRKENVTEGISHTRSFRLRTHVHTRFGLGSWGEAAWERLWFGVWTGALNMLIFVICMCVGMIIVFWSLDYRMT